MSCSFKAESAATCCSGPGGTTLNPQPEIGPQAETASDAQTPQPVSGWDAQTHVPGWDAQTHVGGLDAQMHVPGCDAQKHVGGLHIVAKCDGQPHVRAILQPPSHVSGCDAQKHVPGCDAQKHTVTGCDAQWHSVGGLDAQMHVPGGQVGSPLQTILVGPTPHKGKTLIIKSLNLNVFPTVSSNLGGRKLPPPQRFELPYFLNGRNSRALTSAVLD